MNKSKVQNTTVFLNSNSFISLNFFRIDYFTFPFLQGFFKANLWFYTFYFIHVVLIELLGVLVLWRYGTGWWQVLLSAVLIATSQVHFLFSLLYLIWFTFVAQTIHIDSSIHHYTSIHQSIVS